MIRTAALVPEVQRLAAERKSCDRRVGGKGQPITANDFLPGAGNVVRFPIDERARPTLDVMQELAPDVRVVEVTAEAFGLEVPDADFRHRVERPSTS